MATVRSILLAISLSISVLASPALAEQPSRAYVVGLLFTGAGPDDPLVHAIAKGLSDLGYVNGRDFRFEFRGAQGQLDRLQRLADELVQLKVDVIVVATEAALRAAKQSSTTIPIVANLTDYDPVASGLIDSLAPSRRKRYGYFHACSGVDRQTHRATEGSHSQHVANPGSVWFLRARPA